MTVFTPETPKQVRDAVAWAVAESEPLAVSGGNSKASVGRPINPAHEINLSKLSGITLYEAEELILQAGAGTPLAEIEAALADQNQRLDFEPPNLSALFGLGDRKENRGTLGGAIASNFSGPRRIKSGAARDHFLGFEAVSGRGDFFKSGGRVMKNVTGYDLCKLLAGSWGTIGVMMQATVKVLPVGEKERTVLAVTDDATTAIRAMTEALNSPYDVSGAAWLPGFASRASSVDHVANAGAGVAAIRLEGPAPSVAYRCEKLREAMSAHGDTEELHSHNSKCFWSEVRDVKPLCGGDASRAVWRVSTAPSSGAALYAALTNALTAEGYLDWGGGALWVAVADAEDGGAATIRNALQKHGGHATLIRGGVELRGAISVFHPMSSGVRKLSEKIKHSFDPNGVLNPGRMYDGV